MLVFFAVLVLLYSIGFGLYAARGLEPSPAFDFLYRAGLLCSIIWWIRGDARRHKVKTVYCLGLLVSMGWMIVVPYHLLKTRGAKGWLTIIILAAVFIVAQIASIAAYILFSG